MCIRDRSKTAFKANFDSSNASSRSNISPPLLHTAYHTVCSNGGEMFERLDAFELSKLALNAVLDYLFIFYHGVKPSFSRISCRKNRFFKVNFAK